MKRGLKKDLIKLCAFALLMAVCAVSSYAVFRVWSPLYLLAPIAGLSGALLALIDNHL